MKTQKPQSNRSDNTRQALIKAAIDIFGDQGFHAASTRSLAEAAQVNQALIGYHFGGKDGLYLSAIEYISNRIGEKAGPLIAEITEKIALLEQGEEDTPTLDTDCYLSFLHQITDRFTLILVEEEFTAWARLILREQQAPTPAFEVFYDGMMSRVLQLLTHLAGRIRGIEPQSEQARLLAITIFGQVLVFRAARAAVFRYMNWQKLTTENITAIQSTVRHNITAILTAGEQKWEK